MGRLTDLRGRAAVLVDHLFFAYNDLFFRDREVSDAPALREDRFESPRPVLRDVERFFRRPRRPVTLEVVPGSLRRTGDVEITDLEYDSPCPSGDARNDRVRCRRYRRLAGPIGPTIVFSLPYRLTHYPPFDRFAEQVSAMGYEAVLFQPPYHLDRRSRGGTPGEGIVGANFRKSFQAMRQGFQDLSCLVDALRRDGARGIGLFGMSMGSLYAGHVLCSDPEIQFAVLVAPACCPDTVLRTSPIMRRLRANLERLGIDLGRASALWSAVRLDGRRPAIVPRRILIVGAIHDQIVPIDEVENLIALWGDPPARTFAHGHISILMEPTLLPLALEHLRSVGAIPEP